MLHKELEFENILVTWYGKKGLEETTFGQDYAYFIESYMKTLLTLIVILQEKFWVYITD